MELKNYLGLSLGNKYQMTPEEIDMLAMVLSVLKKREIPVKLEAAPLVSRFPSISRDAIYAIIREHSSCWDLYEFLSAARTAREVYEHIELIIPNRNRNTIEKAALVLLSEWKNVPPVQLAMDNSAPEAEAPAYVGWLTTGKMSYTASGKPEEAVIIDLDAANEEGANVPAVVNVAKMMRAAYDQLTGQLNPEIMERVAEMLAAMFINGQKAAAEMATRAVVDAQAKDKEKSKLWPEDKNHWIYDAQYSAPLEPVFTVGFIDWGKVQADVVRAGRFAISRASGMGTTRVFNIESFISNLVLALIGNEKKESPKPEPVEPAAPAPVAKVSETTPKLNAAAAQPAAVPAGAFQDERPIIPVGERGAPPVNPAIKEQLEKAHGTVNKEQKKPAPKPRQPRKPKAPAKK